MHNIIRILAIETSCDETAASILEGNVTSTNPEFKILSSVVKSQIDLHAEYGGVFPEVAARAHIKAIQPVVTQSIAQAGLKLTDISYIAPTCGPGLAPALLIGVEFAKGLAYSARLALLPTNHMAGHLFSVWNEPNTQPVFPILSLIVSGGHTLLVLQKNTKNYTVLGSTIDDAAGEAFDKVARLLGLAYPGGPKLSKLAEAGQNIFVFPRPMLKSGDYNFSFSGLKTAVRYFLEKQDPNALTTEFKSNVACSFEEAVVEVLCTKTFTACQEFNCSTLAISGGVAANTRLRTQLQQTCKKNNINFIAPVPELCTDNAAMIAIAAYFALRNGVQPTAFTQVQAQSNWEL